jgi:hypothetical protein
MTCTAKSPYAGYRFPGEVISHAVWLYFRFPLSLRMVEEMLAGRGIDVSHETVPRPEPIKLTVPPKEPQLLLRVGSCTRVVERKTGLQGAFHRRSVIALSASPDRLNRAPIRRHFARHRRRSAVALARANPRPKDRRHRAQTFALGHPAVSAHPVLRCVRAWHSGPLISAPEGSHHRRERARETDVDPYRRARRQTAPGR